MLGNWYAIDRIVYKTHILFMAWELEYTDEFEDWWLTLDEDEHESIFATTGLLEEHGPNLPFPHSSDVRGSDYGQMRELRIQHAGRPY